MRPKCRWFLEGLNSDSNEIFGRELEETTIRILVEGEWKSMPVYSASRSQVNFYSKSRPAGNLDFRIWRQYGNATPRIWPFDQTKRNKIKNVRAVIRAMKKKTSRM